MAERAHLPRVSYEIRLADEERSLANVGFLLNAFNLLPIGFLDGGSVFRAISESRRGWIRHENGIPVEAVRPDREQANHITVLYVLVAAALVACLLATRQSGML